MNKERIAVEKSSRANSEDVGAMGVYLLIASLGMLFAAGIVGYLVIRAAHQPWPPPGFPVLPRTLWLSTLAILLCSATIHRALKRACVGELSAMRRYLAATFFFGVVFLGLQALAWHQVVVQISAPSENAGPYLKLFYVLTGLHAVHVLVGLGTLAWVIRRAFAGAYDASHHPGVRYSALYWHFLDAVWCVLFVVVYW